MFGKSHYSGALDFPRVLDDEHPFGGITHHHFIDNGIYQRGLARASAANNKNVPMISDRRF